MLRESEAMTLEFTTPDGAMSVDLRKLTIAGWTGRDQTAVEHHIEELAAIGVPRPSQTPLFYRVSPSLATQASSIAVLGENTSGEIEPLLIRAAGKLWLGVASDHTDRGLEAHSVAHSKQICAKPLGRALWPLDALDGALDAMRLQCWIGSGSGRMLYQDGTLASIMPLTQLLDACPLGEAEAMLCGTLPAIGGIVPASTYKMALSAERQGSLSLEYSVDALDVIS